MPSTGTVSGLVTCVDLLGIGTTDEVALSLAVGTTDGVALSLAVGVLRRGGSAAVQLREIGRRGVCHGLFRPVWFLVRVIVGLVSGGCLKKRLMKQE